MNELFLYGLGAFLSVFAAINLRNWKARRAARKRNAAPPMLRHDFRGFDRPEPDDRPEPKPGTVGDILKHPPLGRVCPPVKLTPRDFRP